MPIYTKKGDKGETKVLMPEGTRPVNKDSLIVEALGAVDELDSYLGVVKTAGANPELVKRLTHIQTCLLTIGSLIAGSGLKLSKTETTKLEKLIDKLDLELPPLKNFVVPGGTVLSAHLQYSRSLARRAERRVVALSKEQKVPDSVKTFLNRLSDALFTLARYENYKASIKDEIWVGKK